MDAPMLLHTKIRYPHMQVNAYGQIDTPVGAHLWGHTCGDTPVGTHLWGHTCGDTDLWGHPCGDTPVETPVETHL